MEMVWMETEFLGKFLIWGAGFLIFFTLFAYFLFRKEFRRSLTHEEIASQISNKHLSAAIMMILMVVWLILGYKLFGG